jgi:hypothetical protein
MKSYRDYKIAELPYWLLVIVAVILGLICHLTFGWSFWMVLLLVHFIWAAEKITRWLYVPAVLLVGWVMFASYLPNTAAKTSFGILAVDLAGSKVIDSVQVKADFILEAERNRQKEAALGRYASLLRLGKIEQAKSLLDSIDQRFDSVKKTKIESAEPEIVSLPARDIIELGYGTHYINMQAGDTSATYHINGRYCVTTDKKDRAELLYPTYGPLKLWKSGYLPDEYNFKINSLVTQRVKIRVY